MKKSFKKGTELLTFLATALMFSALININEICGLAAFGIYVFLFIYDPAFRRMF